MRAWCGGLLLLVVAVGGQELISDGGFESSSHAWVCGGCTAGVVTTGAHSGHRALQVTGRNGVFNGPSLSVPLKAGARYRLQAYVRQLNDVTSHLFQQHILKVTYHWTGQSHAQSVRVVYHSTVRAADGWFSMFGYLKVPNRALSSAQLHLQGPAAHVSFMLDDVSLQQLNDTGDWRHDANARIENVRKGNVHFKVHLPHSVDPSDISIQVDQTKSLFRFGTLVKDDYILDPHYKGYQDIVYRLFNIATLQSVKWKFDKGTQGHPNYTLALAAIAELKSHGMDVRGHNLFWGFTKNVPTWVPPLSPAQLNATVQERLHYMANITRGQLLHWDVMNELVHGQWFEERLNDPDFSQSLFRQLKALDPHPTLMLNEFHVAAEDDVTDAYLQQAQKFLASGTPLEALGLQSHFLDYAVPDPVLMKYRLDHLSRAGLPLWVTELSVVQQDTALRADYYEDVFRLYFSHPAVHGIVLWGFWDQQSLHYASLVDGPHYTMNEAGQRVAKLITEDWATHTNLTLSTGTSGSNLNIRAFKGDYDVTIRRSGVPVKLQSFSLTGSDVTVNIALTGNEAPLQPAASQLPSTVAPVTSNTTPSTRGAYVIGHATSSSTSPRLQCTLRWSHLSEVGDDEKARVACHAGEVMTACSSRLANDDWHRDGEKIQHAGGQVQCVAINGFHSTAGVKAMAVCCHGDGLTCTYRGAGPSLAGHDTTVEATCGAGERPMGCSASNAHSQAGGVRLTNASCVAVNQDLMSGVYVYGACCSGPNLSCTSKIANPSGPHSGDASLVQCDAGDVMTGCNVMAGEGKAAGAIITSSGNTTCRAYNGANSGQTGVTAIATCCRITSR